MGARLLARTTRSLSLTDEGRRFGEHVIRTSPASRRAAPPHPDPSQQGIRTAAGQHRSLLLAHCAVSASGSFLARYPDVSVQLIMRDAVGDLVADGFDPAVRFGEPPIGSFVARKITETRVLTVASPAYIKAHGRPRHPKELAQRDCIDFYDAANARPYDWEVRRKKEVIPLRVKGRLLVSDSGTLIGACEAGAGIAQVLELGCKHLVQNGRLVELFPEWSDERFPLMPYIPHSCTARLKCGCSSSFAWKSWPESQGLAVRRGSYAVSIARERPYDRSRRKADHPT